MLLVQEVGDAVTVGTAEEDRRLTEVPLSISGVFKADVVQCQCRMLLIVGDRVAGGDGVLVVQGLHMVCGADSPAVIEVFQVMCFIDPEHIGCPRGMKGKYQILLNYHYRLLKTESCGCCFSVIPS
jgi:hypothetical protein